MRSLTPINAQLHKMSAKDFKLARSNNPRMALGMAVNFLMTKPAFAQLRFGDWSRILVGQINRGHYYFVIDNTNRVQGFIGWALTTKEKAEDWVESRRSLSSEDSTAGECVVFNAWAANSSGVHRFLVDEVRKIVKDKETMYFKRYYWNGRVRPVRLNVNEFVASRVMKASEPQDDSALILEMR